MKRIILFLMIVGVNSSTFSQTIVDFFKSVPDTSLLNLSKEVRMEIVKHSLDNQSVEDAYQDLGSNEVSYAFDILDVQNGYLRLIGAIEGHVQMCYWNLTNRNKLIAIYVEACGPVCFMEQFDFYEFDGREFTPINWQIVIPDIYGDFFLDNRNVKMEEMEGEDILATLLFDLPRTGKNIMAKWGNEESQDIYKKYAVGDRMVLKWDDGKFIKSDIYWK